MPLLNFPTYDQITAIPIGSKVEVHLRERTGERCIVTGNVHTSESGVRKLGPIEIAGLRRTRYGSLSRSGEEVPTRFPYVPESVVCINVISTPTVVS